MENYLVTLIAILVLLRTPAFRADAVAEPVDSQSLGNGPANFEFSRGKFNNNVSWPAVDPASLSQEMTLANHTGNLSGSVVMWSPVLFPLEKYPGVPEAVGALLGCAAIVVLNGAAREHYYYKRKTSRISGPCLKKERVASSDLETGLTSSPSGIDQVMVDRQGDFSNNGWLMPNGHYNLQAIGDEIGQHQLKTQRIRRCAALGATLGVACAFWMLLGIIGTTIAVVGMGGICAAVMKLLNRDTEEAEFMWTTSLEPKVCTLSYPVEMRGQLMRILLNTMKLVLDPTPEYCEVHALHNPQSCGYDDQISFPEALPSWSTELMFFRPQWNWFNYGVLKEYGGEGLYDLGAKPYAFPNWLVRDFAPAAYSCASQNNVDGRGVILFAGWPGYFSSDRCRLEFAFARVLAKKFRGSVYVYTGTDCTDRPGGRPHGYYMTGMEKIPNETAPSFV